MIYRKLDANGDYVLGQNANGMLSDKEAVAQAILTRLKLLKSEWWEDQEDGLPLWQEILGKRNVEKANQEIKKRILETPKVKQITSFEAGLNNETRQYVFSAVVITEYGLITLSEEALE